MTHDPDATLRIRDERLRIRDEGLRIRDEGAGGHGSGAAPPAGRVGRYEILGRVGAGGMGEVFRAHDPVLGRTIAIKRLFADRVTAMDVARLEREAQALAQLSHPHVVAVYDVIKEADGILLAMEYVDGAPLGGWLAERKRKLSEILDAFGQAAAGLAAMHEAGLVHRDFKPSNVLVGRDGRARVLDFGLARPARRTRETPAPRRESWPRLLAEDLTKTGVLAGTPRYMAPEQFLEEEVGPAADQFAFCAALYEATTGRRPFAGDDVLELAKNVVAHRVLPIRSEDQLPDWLSQLILRGLARDPRDRHASFDEIERELRRDRQKARHQALDGTRARDIVAAFPPPEDPALLERIEWLLSRIDYAAELKKKGDYEAALALLSVVVREARGLAYPPLAAAALYALGNLQHRSGDSVTARDTLYLAADEAARAGDDWQLANVWVFLVGVAAEGLGRMEEAHALVAVAGAAVLRIGDNPSLRSRLLHAEGRLLRAQGRAHEARRLHDLALGIDARTHGESHPFVAVSLVELAECEIELDRFGAAEARASRALALCEQARRQGPTSADALFARGRAELGLGRVHDAESTLGEALTRLARYPDRRFDQAAIAIELAACRLQLGDPEHARELSLAATATQRECAGRRLVRARGLLVLARALELLESTDRERIDGLRALALRLANDCGERAGGMVKRLGALG